MADYNQGQGEWNAPAEYQENTQGDAYYSQDPNQAYYSQDPNQAYYTQDPNQAYYSQDPNQAYYSQDPNQAYYSQDPNQAYYYPQQDDQNQAYYAQAGGDQTAYQGGQDQSQVAPPAADETKKEEKEAVPAQDATPKDTTADTQKPEQDKKTPPSKQRQRLAPGRYTKPFYVNPGVCAISSAMFANNGAFASIPLRRGYGNARIFRKRRRRDVRSEWTNAFANPPNPCECRRNEAYNPYEVSKHRNKEGLVVSSIKFY